MFLSPGVAMHLQNCNAGGTQLHVDKSACKHGHEVVPIGGKGRPSGWSVDPTHACAL